jgi:hypothetical protein
MEIPMGKAIEAWKAEMLVSVEAIGSLLSESLASFVL